MEYENLSQNELRAVRYIRNSLIHRGESPSVRDIMNALGYSSPRSADLILKGLIKKKILKRRSSGHIQLLNDQGDSNSHARTVDVPLVGTIACGSPIFAQENIETTIPISIGLARPGHRYFFLRAKGDSMTEADIHEGDFVLVRQQTTAKNGDIVVALIDDEATIKEFHIVGSMIILKPRSKSKRHQPIILKDNFQIQGIVTTTIPGLILKV